MITFSFEKDIARFHSAWSEWKYIDVSSSYGSLCSDVCGIVFASLYDRGFVGDNVSVIKVFQSDHCVHLAFSARHNTTGCLESPVNIFNLYLLFLTDV